MGEENNLSCKERFLVRFIPCVYLNNPDLAASDYCLCCHEKKRIDHLNIPPLIKMSSTWINAETPIPQWFIMVRCILTALMIAIITSNFALYVSDDKPGYWFIYFTQWNITIATISMILKCVTMFSVIKVLKAESMAEFSKEAQRRLYTSKLDPKSKLWKLHIASEIFLQTSIPAESMVVFKFSLQILSNLR